MPEITIQVEKNVISLSEGGRVVSFGVEDAVKASGKKLATFMDVVMDQTFLDRKRGAWAFIDPKGAPRNGGWYHIDRQNEVLVPISEREANDFEWHETLFVRNSKSGREHWVLYIGMSYGDAYGLHLNGNPAPGFDARVALVEKSSETITQHVSALLRVDNCDTLVLIRKDGERAEMGIEKGTVMELR